MSPNERAKVFDGHWHNSQCPCRNAPQGEGRGGGRSAAQWVFLKAEK